mmetsp:Transcript_24112/g.61370  ORF Transcript_24112/g.61370 Transcript_24112/m.61370 type:complete len:223 (-) Transcript_24112:232-900(-)
MCACATWRAEDTRKVAAALEEEAAGACPSASPLLSPLSTGRSCSQYCLMADAGSGREPSTCPRRSSARCLRCRQAVCCSRATSSLGAAAEARPAAPGPSSSRAVKWGTSVCTALTPPDTSKETNASRARGPSSPATSLVHAATAACEPRPRTWMPCPCGSDAALLPSADWAASASTGAAERTTPSVAPPRTVASQGMGPLSEDGMPGWGSRANSGWRRDQAS